MPTLIRNIDEYFRAEKHDLYYIIFGNRETEDWLEKSSKNPPGRQELLDWFAEFLPDTVIEPIFPFTYRSGILCAPYPGSLYVDFTPDTLATFCQRWENTMGGSLDPRFQCYYYPLAMYLENNGGVYPTPPWEDEDWNP